MASLCLFCAISVVKMAYDKTKKWNKMCHMKPLKIRTVLVLFCFFKTSTTTKTRKMVPITGRARSFLLF